jgi:hypothetical protein
MNVLAASVLALLISWTPAATQPQGVYVKSYIIWRSEYGGPLTYYTTVGSAQTSYTDTNIYKKKVYCYAIQAKDTAGATSARTPAVCKTARYEP